MARNRNAKAYRPKPPYISVEGIKSPAFEELSPYAVCVLIYLYRKFDGYNRSMLVLTKSEMKHQMSAPSLGKSVWELIAFGFVDVVEWGGLNVGESPRPSRYRLSHRWQKIGESYQKRKTLRRLLSQIDVLKRENICEGRKQKIRALRKKVLKVSEAE